MRKILPGVGFALSLVLLSAGTTTLAGAQVVSRLSLEELAGSSDYIIHGVVSSVTADWNEEHTLIYTTIDIDLRDQFAGEPLGGALRLRQLGGTVDGIDQAVLPTLPGYVKGEEVLLFLRSVQGGQLVVSGLTQGKFTVRRDPRAVEARVTRDWVDGSLAPPASGTDPAGLVGYMEMIRAIRKIAGR